MSLRNLKQRALSNPAVKAEYDKLEDEFNLVDKLISMRSKAGLTQEQVAVRMGTQKSNISRLERGNGNPGWSTLVSYAHACGFELSVTTKKLVN
ncbi:helix-turn-helix domain-containing protein [Solemya velum gill symbiont]|uniref:Transcriptional regulator n=1 Tax=Solemya velum gill symbiont TaxID=2340 RepID=A0A1T2N737_SOVGS|nr:helix-turn-helix transcriptional regulator [Solemya velum gill symbiont]OOY33917.1 transcriptional regulator [Solemya velum gill symbiont]OOY36571.1 transcriptional regulator [Solemya velum gill symbiont]OOY38973.1 transcriptional regulator [Solemya velum gill symbiont]OOY42198.1 transcriptional regulator [Solemya velum gill symbiont]OOY45699.1 transcriptional regulator [Solemya velum gill symbiont]